MLVADDDESSSFLLSTLMRRIGFKTLIAVNGQEAVDICRQNSSVDLILMDISMPVMNGLEATKIIKEFNPGIVIIAQTAFSLFGDKEVALNAGCDEYISKPIDREELYSLIHKFIKEDK